MFSLVFLLGHALTPCLQTRQLRLMADSSGLDSQTASWSSHRPWTAGDMNPGE